MRAIVYGNPPPKSYRLLTDSPLSMISVKYQVLKRYSMVQRNLPVLEENAVVQLPTEGKLLYFLTLNMYFNHTSHCQL
jgi:hypothetical protein